MPLSVLVSSAGRRVQLVECFRADARELGIDLRVVAADMEPAMSAACNLADQWMLVPRCTSEEFVPRMCEICASENISLVVPTIDTELQVLADNRDRFAEVGAQVAISSPEVVRMARNKAATAAFLRSHGIETPRTAALSEFLTQPEGWRWPVVIKPVGGSSSIGIQVVQSVEEARAAAAQRTDYLAQELWKGREYTVNVYFNSTGRLVSAVPHYRAEVRAGEVSKGITERQPTLTGIAARLGEALHGALGALCFQAMVAPDGRAAVFEINARFGGGYPLAHQAGAKFSRWLLEEVAGRPSSANDQWEEGLVMLRYDAAVFRKPGRLV